MLCMRGLTFLPPKAALESPLDITEVSWVSQASVSLQVIHQSCHCSVIVLTDGIEVQLRIATCKVIKTGSFEPGMNTTKHGEHGNLQNRIGLKEHLPLKSRQIFLC